MGLPRLFSSHFFRAAFASTADSRRNNFDFLRFLLATLVLFYHCFGLLPPGGPGARGRDGAGGDTGGRGQR